MQRVACARLAGAVSLALLAPACAVFDAFAPPGPRAVSFVYAGDTVLTVGQRPPLDITVLADGRPLPGQRLRVASSDSTVLTLTAASDTLIPLKVGGRATLAIRLVHSSAPDADMPDTTIAFRIVAGGP